MVEVDGGLPAVIARKPAPAGQPTVLLYAHHDVQPEGARETGRPSRSSRPSATAGCSAAAPPTTRPGSRRTWLPCARTATTCRSASTVFVEGEEESGSPSLPAILEQHRDELASRRDGDRRLRQLGHRRAGSDHQLRGLADCVVEVRTLDHAVHSGMWGGLSPDALTTL